MKILHVLDHSLPLHSGYTFRSQNIFRCQREAGMEPVVVTSPKHEASWQGESPEREDIDGVPYYRTGRASGSRLPFLAEVRLMGRLQRRLREVAARERPAVLHAHSPVLNAFPALRVGKALGIPVVYEIRAFWEDAAVDHGSYAEGSAKYRLVRRLETRACRKADRIVTICEGLRDDLIARGIPAGKITVVPNAVNPDEFRPAAGDPELARRWGLDGAFVVGFLGSFYHYEGLDLLLEAVAQLTNGSRVLAHGSRFAIPDSLPLKLLLVGGGAMEKSLKGQAKRLGLEHAVVFTGRLPHNQMPGMYGLTDVLAFPRKLMRLTKLVTPLKPLETMAMAKPVLASDVGGHRELIRDGDTGVLFRAGDAGDLARALGRLTREPDLCARLGAAGRAWVAAERAWSSNGPRYARLYGEVLASPGGAT
ncbi:MAG: TIGR04063 family PEP-CTERM/XrtA system glycosyltransferase [Deferrisomatales bacterium]